MTAKALGATTRTEYDLLGRETAQIDAKGRRTTMVNDAYGRRIATTYPVGTIDLSTFDPEGNTMSDTDRLSRTKHYLATMRPTDWWKRPIQT